MVKVYIDSSCDIYYSSYYIRGLQEVLGKKAIQYTSKYFLSFKHNNQFFCIVFKGTDFLKKVTIDFGDDSSIAKDAYHWSDVYAKINILHGDLSKYDKLLSIGPSFGINLYSLGETLVYAFKNLLNANFRISNKRRFLADYKAQLRRPTMAQYLSSEPSLTNYLYFSSSLWKKEPETNAFRANFMRAVKSNSQINFEGGFAPRNNRDMAGFEALTMESRTKMIDYLAKTKRSFAVFNTPAVFKCHGWKLGEFLALGKAIISTPFSRELPNDLVDGKHFLQTDGSEEDIKRKLNYLLSNKILWNELENNANSYFLKYLAPDKVIINIMKRMKICNGKILPS